MEAKVPKASLARGFVPVAVKILEIAPFTSSEDKPFGCLWNPAIARTIFTPLHIETAQGFEGHIVHWYMPPVPGLGSAHCNHTSCKVYIVPRKSEKLTSPQARVDCYRNQGTKVWGESWKKFSLFFLSKVAGAYIAKLKEAYVTERIVPDLLVPSGQVVSGSQDLKVVVYKGGA
jgi:hypothetical protein